MINDKEDELEGKALENYDEMMTEKDKLLGDDNIEYDETPTVPNIIQL
jgi:hypothetical protein